jgi:ubiquitin carboxyl-terminal hydrolase 34
MVDQESQDRQMPELFSPNYLHHLHSITLPPRSSDSQTDHVALASSYFIRTYRESVGGSIGSLLQLTKILVKLIPSHPRLTNDMASICQVASDIMTDIFNPRIPSNNSTSYQELENGFGLYELVCSILDDMIEKKPSQLFADNVLRGISALSDMIKVVLKCGLPIASRLLQEYRKASPTLSHDYAIEAIALKRRFETFIRLLRSSQMQLRFQGTTQMCRELVECWKVHSEQGDDDSLSYIGHVAEYLIGSGFIDYFLGSNCHPEITVEGANIVGFIIVTKKYRREHIDVIWRGITSGEDPRTVDALARMMINIAHLFDIEGLLVLCEKFQTLPVDAFTPTIRVLWEHVMKFITDRPTTEQPLGVQPYNLCLRLLRESSAPTGGSQPISPEMQQAAVHKLQELLRYGPGPDGRQQLYLNCLQDIANKSATTLGSLFFLIITIRSRVMSTELHGLVEEHDFTRLLVEELEHVIKVGRAMNARMVLASPIYQPRREFIGAIIQLEPQTITQNLGSKLWDMLVGSLSLSLEDRRAGWDVLNSLHRGSNIDIHSNHFLRTCLFHYLPTLSAEYFCDGMLEFLLAEIMPRLNEKSNLALDDQEAVNKSGIEQLWRIALEAEDENLAERSLRVLTKDVYIENEYISSNPAQRTQTIHLALVGRCLQQLKIAAKDLETLGHNPRGDDDGGTAFAAKGQRLQEKERIFVRSLKFLRYMLDAHRSKPYLSTPDLRTLISQAPYAVQGDSAELKYQSFDGDQQTDIKPLVIGKGNTAASLLASLREETGFENYRVYYKGQPFLPRETDICKSLEDLRVHDGLILVRREESGPALSNRVTPGASSLEIEISAHFEEIWEYLSMGDSLAEEVSISFILIEMPN